MLELGFDEIKAKVKEAIKKQMEVRFVAPDADDSRRCCSEDACAQLV